MLVRERGRAMAAAERRDPDRHERGARREPRRRGGGDRGTRADGGQQERHRPGRRRRHAGTAGRAGGRSPGQGAGRAASGRRRLPHRRTWHPPSRSLAGLRPCDHAAATPGPPALERRRRRGDDRRARPCGGSSTRSRNPVRWDACSDTLRELGVTGAPRPAARRHPRRSRQARPARRRHPRPEDPRRPRAAHGQLIEPPGARPRRPAQRQPTVTRPQHHQTRQAETPRHEHPVATPTAPPTPGIMSVGSYRPERVVTNDEIVEPHRLLRPVDPGALRHRSRRWAAPDESVIDMAEAAAHERPGARRPHAADVDAVIVATVTHPYQTPSAAAARAPSRDDARRGLRRRPRRAPASATASARQRHGARRLRPARPRGRRREALRLHRPHDRSTAFIFGDGAGAAVIGPAATPPASAPPCGVRTAPSGGRSPTRTSWIEYRESEGAVARAGDGRPDGVPLGVRADGARRAEGPGRGGGEGGGPRRLHPPLLRHARPAVSATRRAPHRESN